jgi:plasmid stabilization system protein ParE
VRVKWLHAALDDLSAHFEYIAQENPAAAFKTVLRIRRTVDFLAAHAGIGRPGRVPGTRELVITGTPFIVPYRVGADEVEVLRVFHAARKWPTEL